MPAGSLSGAAGLKKSLIGFYRILYEEMVVNPVDGSEILHHLGCIKHHKTLEIM